MGSEGYIGTQVYNLFTAESRNTSNTVFSVSLKLKMISVMNSRTLPLELVLLGHDQIILEYSSDLFLNETKFHV